MDRIEFCNGWSDIEKREEFDLGCMYCWTRCSRIPLDVCCFNTGPCFIEEQKSVLSNIFIVMQFNT